MPSVKSLTEQNTVEVPLYTSFDAARYLHTPLSLAATFATRHHYDRFWIFDQFRRDRRDSSIMLKLIEGEDIEELFPKVNSHKISFRSLATFFIVSAFVRPLASFYRTRGMHLEAYFEHFVWIFREVDKETKLLTEPEWVVKRCLRGSNSLPEEDTLHLIKLIALHQSRVESREGIPTQLFPFSRDPAADAPRTVLIDPEIRFGRPTVKGVPTDAIAERWLAGDSSADLAEDYSLTLEEVEESLRYEAMPISRFLYPYLY